MNEMTAANKRPLRRVELPLPEDSRREVAAILLPWAHPSPVQDLVIPFNSFKWLDYVPSKDH